MQSAAWFALLLGVLAGCHGKDPTQATGGAPGNTAESTPATAATTTPTTTPTPDKDAGVALTAEQIQKLGLQTQAAVAAKYSQETPGFGVILPHEPIATAVAELVSVQATLHQADAALARQQRLAGTAGAVSADALDASIQQAAVAKAQVQLSRQKLTTLVGQNPPWPDTDYSTLEKLASGRLKLLRMTFPRDVSAGEMPWQVRAAPIGAPPPSAGTSTWATKKIWSAPADPGVPGRSFFALLDGNKAAEGERLQVWASTGQAEEGTVVPVAAVLMHSAKYWTYLEKQPGLFSRVEVDLDKPTAGGYFVARGIAPGDKLVISATSELLAQETGSSAADD